MWPLGMPAYHFSINLPTGITNRDSPILPEVFLDIFPEYLTPIINKVAHILQFLDGLFDTMSLDNRTGHNADVAFLCEISVLLEIGLPLPAEIREFGVCGQPVCEVVFWEDGEITVLCGGRADEFGGFLEIGF